MKKLLAVMCAVVSIFLATGTASAFFLNFEEGSGHDGQAIINIPGITFEVTGGQNWVYGDSSTGLYNTRSIDLGYGGGSYQHYGNVFAWLGSNQGSGKIDFTNNDGTWFQTGYTSASTFYMEGYDSTGAKIASTSGGANLNSSDMGWLIITAPTGQTFDYVMVHDTGNYWLMDNMSGDTTGVGAPVPEPATMLLLSSGLVGLAGFGRKKFFKKG